jgi:uncharacterized protein (DUF2062 family)
MFGGGRNWRMTLRRILHTRDSPPRTAAAVSLGVFIGLSPFLGLHTVLALGLAFALRLNRLAVLGGSFVANPISYAAGTWLGLVLLGRHPDGVPELTLSGFSSPLAVFRSLGPYLAPFILGNVVLSALIAISVFPLTLVLVRRFRAARDERRQRRKEARAAALAARSESP